MAPLLIRVTLPKNAQNEQANLPEELSLSLIETANKISQFESHFSFNQPGYIDSKLLPTIKNQSKVGAEKITPRFVIQIKTPDGKFSAKIDTLPQFDNDSSQVNVSLDPTDPKSPLPSKQIVLNLT